MLRAARSENGQLGYKFHLQNTLLGIGARNDILYLVRPVGPQRFEVVSDLCFKLFGVTKRPIMIRKMDTDLYRYLLPINHFHELQIVHDQELLEDESFPETVVNLGTLFCEDFTLSRAAEKLARKARRFQRSGINLTVKSDFYHTDLDTVLTDFRFLVSPDQKKYFAYRAIITEVFSLMPQEKSPYKIITFYENNRLHGFYIGEFLSKDKMGLYCAVSSMAFPGITEWMDVYFLREAFKSGVKDVFLGGAETIGVQDYVRKLLPQLVPYFMPSLIYCP